MVGRAGQGRLHEPPSPFIQACSFCACQNCCTLPPPPPGGNSTWLSANPIRLGGPPECPAVRNSDCGTRERPHLPRVRNRTLGTLFLLMPRTVAL